jgi:hypothetical protein
MNMKWYSSLSRRKKANFAVAAIVTVSFLVDGMDNVVTTARVARPDGKNVWGLVWVDNFLGVRGKGSVVAYTDPMRPLGIMEVGEIQALEREWVDIAGTRNNAEVEIRERVPPGYCWISRQGESKLINLGLVHGIFLASLTPPMNPVESLINSILKR